MNKEIEIGDNLKSAIIWGMFWLALGIGSIGEGCKFTYGGDTQAIESRLSKMEKEEKE